jgi:hypothetical protein
MIALIIFLVITTVVFLYYLGAVTLFGKISDDNDLMMMLRTESKNYYDHYGTSKNWVYSGCQIRQRPWKNGDIVKLKWNPLFTYAIEGMGPIPFWFKVNSVIKTLPGNY